MPFASTTPFPTIFYETDVSNSEVPSRWPVALAGVGFFIDPAKYERRTLPMLRPATDQSTESGEQSRTNEGFWFRSGMDWHKGAGQLYYDRPQSDRARFRASKGVNPWTEGKATLHLDVEQVDASTDTNLRLFPAGSYVYKVEGATVAFSSTGASGSFTSMSFTGMGASVKAITSDGVYIYIGDGANVWRAALGTAGAGAAWSTFDATGLWYCNGRLIAANNNVLTEIDNTGAALGTALKTSTVGFVWTSVVGGLSAIYATQTAGNVSEVYYITVNTTTGALTTPAIATPWPRGETINWIDYYGGFVFFGTSKGFRLGTTSSSNGIDYGALTEITGGVRAFAFDGRFAWFTWTNYDTVSTGLGRIDLGQPVNSDVLQFAYASDLMVTAQGSSLDVVRFSDKTYLAISGVGFYRQAATYVTEGTISQGWVTHNDVEPKVAVAASIGHEPLTGSISFSLGFIDSTTLLCGTSTVVASVNPAESFGAGQRVRERVEPIITLTAPAAAATTPALLLWKLRSLPTGPRMDEIVVPLMIREDVSGDDFNPLEIFQWLKALERSQVPVVYQEGSSSFTVLVDRVAITAEDWAEVDFQTFFKGLFFVRLLTLEL